MPHYFFNTRISGDLIADPEGKELRDADQAWQVARATIVELLRSNHGKTLLKAVLEVTDNEGEIVLEFPFAEALFNREAPATKH